MRAAPFSGAILMCAAVAVGGLVGWRLWRGPPSTASASEAPPAVSAAERVEPGDAEATDEVERPEGLLLSGFVQARTIDPRHWRVVATPLSLSIRDGVRSAELNTRGRFDLYGLADTDYRIELLADGTPPQVLAHADYVRPGQGELVLELDPLQLTRLAAAAGE